MSATNFALTNGPLAIPKLDERFTADKPELQKFMADPGFKLWQEALEEQAAARQEAERAQAAEDAAKAVSDEESLRSSGAAPDSKFFAGDAVPINDDLMDLDEELLENLRAAATDKRAFADLIGQQGIVKKQRQG